ncbi:hypothetical protein B4O97_03600 [Marispirochaeta aestuarii]|uniref:YqaJ viral recombinase domain-containing protein n=1 Tax=Marispirochaeta aestuarii TaxID=1963862 RepID=A0A1Y1S1H6_9SPIO|nr:YqaJ viral recombinase family protein [Marispirochaeta aestuarii]ORC37287.1 hypothetical protein B4O97_03600 [Marispirochaeta aestuarii]
MIHLTDCEPIAAYSDITEEEWLSLRKTGIGGSDAGAIMGHSKYGSPLTVCLEKTGRYVPEDISEEEPVAVGNILEPIIRREIVGPYIREKLLVNVDVIDPTHTYRSIKYLWMIINPDGFLNIPGDTVGLEIKTGSSYRLKEWGGKDGDSLPDTYYDQVQHYMAGTGLNEWWVFGLIGNTRLLRIVPRNEGYIADLAEREREIWEAIQKNDPLYFPLPMGLDAETDALMQYGDPQGDETIDLSDMQGEIDRYLQLKIQIDDLTEERKRINQKIIMELKRSKYGETGKYKITWSRFNRSSFNKEQFEKDHPGMIDPYVTTSESGRLSVKVKE